MCSYARLSLVHALGERTLVPLLMRTLISIWGSTLRICNYPSKGHLLIPLHWWMGLRHMNSGQDKHIHPITPVQPSGFLPTVFLHPLSLKVRSSGSLSFNSLIHLCHPCPPSSFHSPHSLQILLAGLEKSLALSSCHHAVSQLYQLSTQNISKTLWHHQLQQHSLASFHTSFNQPSYGYTLDFLII